MTIQQRSQYALLQLASFAWQPLKQLLYDHEKKIKGGGPKWWAMRDFVNSRLPVPYFDLKRRTVIEAFDGETPTDLVGWFENLDRSVSKKRTNPRFAIGCWIGSADYFRYVTGKRESDTALRFFLPAANGVGTEIWFDDRPLAYWPQLS